MNTKQKFQIKKLIKELDSIRGRHTELVTVYVPAGYDLNKIISHLAQEQGTASNIKDKTTRDHVIDSLEKMIRHLRLFKRTPENGMAVFSGNASEKESKVDIKVWSIEPPVPIKTRMYRCDQTFVTDILKSMIESKDLYALIVVDRRDGTVGVLKGSSIETLSHLTSGVPGKFKAGGQSAHRFERLIEGMAKEFFKRVAEVANKEFLFSLVDSDDATNAMRNGKPVWQIYPDQEEGGLGCLVLPNATVLIKGGPNPENGKELIDYLLSPETELELAFADCAQIPLHEGVETPDDVIKIEDLKSMKVDFEAVAKKLQEIQPYLKEWVGY